MKFVGFAICLFALAVAGCGGSVSETKTKVAPPDPTQQIKTTLEFYAESGEVDSGLMTVREQAEALKATDPAKAETILKGVDELESAKDPSKVKAKAKEMLEQL